MGMMRLKNREKVALLTPQEQEAVVEPVLDDLDREYGPDTSLLLSEQAEFWEAIRLIKVAQHRKSWRLGVNEGRRRSVGGRDG